MKKTLKTDQKSPKKSNFFSLYNLRLVTTLFTLLTMLGTTNSLIAQKFNGVELNQSTQIVVNNLIAKGWVQTEKKTNYITLSGKVINDQVSLTIYSTLTSRKVRKIVLFYVNATTWQGANTSYDAKVAMLKGKYGEPSDKYEKFEEPYFYGDGYELQAFDQDKCTWMTLWSDMPLYPNLNVSTEISKSAIVLVTYEILSNMELHRIELQNAQQNVY